MCGTYAFQPKCTYIVSAVLCLRLPCLLRIPGLPYLTLPVSFLPQDVLTFTLEHREFDDGKGKCPYDPAKGHTALLVGEWQTLLQAGVSQGCIPTQGCVA